MFKKKSVETKTADTLLSGGVSLSLFGQEVTAPTPTLATWFEVSGLLSQLSEPPQDEATLFDLLTLGKDAEIYAKILASFLVGVQRDNARERTDKANELLYQLSISELSSAFFAFLEQTNIGELFMLTASLKQMRLTQPTRGAESGVTARGGASDPSQNTTI